MDVDVIQLDRHEDPRGWLLKMLMRGQLGATAEFGEIYVVSSVPGEIRAQHYHKHTTEWFCVISGQAELALVDVASGERRELSMDGTAPCTVRIPPGIAHAVRNTGTGEMCMIAYADRPYDPADDDTFRFAI